MISLATRLCCSWLQLSLCTYTLLQQSGLANCNIALYVTWQISVVEWSLWCAAAAQMDDTVLLRVFGAVPCCIAAKCVFTGLLPLLLLSLSTGAMN